MDEWIKITIPHGVRAGAKGDIMFEDLNGDKVINEGANTVDDRETTKLLVTPPHVSGLVLDLEL